jgi:hypothetical protein
VYVVDMYTTILRICMGYEDLRKTVGRFVFVELMICVGHDD